MAQFLVLLVLLAVAAVAVAGSYRLIRDDGGPRRSPLPAEPSEGNTILPYPRRRRPFVSAHENVVVQRRRAMENRLAQYSGGRVNI